METDAYRREFLKITLVAGVLAIAIGSVATDTATAEAAPDAAKILRESGVKGGLVVHLGCGDGRLTAALYAGEGYLVHGLDTDAEQVAAAREHIRSLGRYGTAPLAAGGTASLAAGGTVSVDTFDGRHLPYADNLVNLVLVSDAACRVSAEEIERVLVPRGAAVLPTAIKHEAAGLLPVDARPSAGRFVYYKPVPPTIDSWSHHLQGPDNNAVANDSVVATPRRLKWACGPLWSRSHEFLSSLSAMVSADGRIFYVVDEGLPGTTDQPIPERWMLTARDALNGVLLWKKPLTHWGADAWGKRALRSTPRDVPTRFVAGGDRLFAMLTASGPVTVLDAATGKHLMDVPGTENARDMRYLDGVLLVRCGGNRITAVDVESGDKLWQDDGKINAAIAASNGKAYYLNGGRLVCCGLKDGGQLWQKEAVTGVTQLLLHENHLLMAVGKQIKALDAESGRERWSVAGRPRSPFFVAKDRVWLGLGSLDLATGESMPPLDASDVHTPGHHARCYPGKATENYLLTPNRGVEFVSLTGGPNTQNDWLRGPCTFGVLPCNGLLYVPPNPCFCYPGVKLTGFNVFAGEAAEARGQESSGQEANRFEKGPAYGFVPSGVKPQASEWPQYRQNARRTGGVATTVDTALEKGWSVELGGRLTQPVIATGRVVIVSKDTHTVYVLDEKSGRQVWTYTAGGRIDSPPTVHGERILFGCTDGWVYCLRASDGQLAWRFRAAPSDRRIIAFDQLESPWRVHGSVLIEGGVAYCTAGRSTNLDGGIRVYGLDPATGKVIHQTRLDSWSRTRIDAIDKPFIPSYHMEGAFSDVLVSAGGSIYLGQYRLDLALKQQDVPYAPFANDGQAKAMGMEELLGKPYTENMETQKRDEVVQRDWQLRVWPKMSEEYRKRFGGSSMGDRQFGRHIFAVGGFLDDTYFNRTYWMHSETWPGFHIANRAAKTGQILSVDDKNTYALQAFPRRNLQSPLFTPGQKGYLLLADANDNEPVVPEYTRGVPKGIGFTRRDPPQWFQWIPLRVRAMVAAENALFVSGPPDAIDPDDPMASFDGRMGGELWALSKRSGEKITQIQLESPPVFDGMSAAAGGLYVSTVDGQVICYGSTQP